MERRIRITLYTSEILHDVAVETYLVGESGRTEDNQEAIALVQSADEERNVDKIMRSINSSYASIYYALSSRIADNTEIADNMIWNKEDDLTLVLLVTSNFDRSMVDTIASAAHDYVTNMAKGDWFIATDKEDAAQYYQTASSSMDLLKKALKRRLRPQRPVIPIEILKGYFGKVSDTFKPTVEGIKALDMTFQSARIFKGVIKSLDNEKICYAYPSKFGDITSITDGSNFEYLSSYEKSIIKLNDMEYNCYVLREPVTIGQSIKQNFI